MDAPRARSRPPPPPRRPPLTAAIAAIPAPITNATPVAITASDCATIDATLASTIAPPDAPHGRGPLGVMDTVARARGGEGPPWGFTMLTHLGASPGCVKPRVGTILAL